MLVLPCITTTQPFNRRTDNVMQFWSACHHDCCIHNQGRRSYCLLSRWFMPQQKPWSVDAANGHTLHLHVKQYVIGLWHLLELQAVYQAQPGCFCLSLILMRVEQISSGRMSAKLHKMLRECSNLLARNSCNQILCYACPTHTRMIL
jgi:hypothetical protein